MDFGSSFDLKSFASRLGVTRIANLTGLDRVGYPVMAAIRPSSRNLSVSFGKGPGSEAASRSAVMEAAELFYSETLPGRPLVTSYASLPSSRACDPATLFPVMDDHAIRNMTMEWIEGRDLLTGVKRLVPWQTTSMDFTTAARATKRVLGFGATGLAAGFDEDFAIQHGLLEVIERHAHDTWNRLDDDAKLQTLVDHRSCTDATTRGLINRIENAQLSLVLWDMTHTTTVPCYLAELCDFADDAPTPFAQGAAAHPDPQTAIQKALAEAMQVRLTYIAGGRDDLDWSDYGTRYDAVVNNRKWLLQQGLSGKELPETCNVPAPGDVNRNIAAKLPEHVRVTVVRLSPVEEQVAVVKVIVPEMTDIPDVDAFMSKTAVA